MLRFVVRRLFALIPILFGVSVLIFFWVHNLPGGPTDALLGERATPALEAAYKQKFGLDKPLPVQYVKYINTVLHGDRGVWTADRRTIVDDIKTRFPAT